ncbi:MAG: hypothetical protein H0U94_03255 [Acidobacteria bacterium]|jgi:hypothetical protein|nr:hypothetical protein [Acidobacteriota bacterium]
MRIVVRLTPDAARQARTPGIRSTRGTVLGWLETPLTPVHPRPSGTELDTFFELNVEDPSDAPGLLGRLQEDPAVEAAYTKPDDELPSM